MDTYTIRLAFYMLMRVARYRIVICGYIQTYTTTYYYVVEISDCQALIMIVLCIFNFIFHSSTTI